MLLGPAAIALAPRAGEPVTVFFNPLLPLSDAIGALAPAGGAFVRLGPARAIIRSDDPDIVQNLYRHGALLVLRSPFAAGCEASARRDGAPA